MGVVLYLGELLQLVNVRLFQILYLNKILNEIEGNDPEIPFAVLT